MCAKPIPSEYLRPVAVLLQEFGQYQQPSPISEFHWAGIATLTGICENA